MKKYKTIVVSDIHLGTKGSKAREVVRFLKEHSCDRLILNGDIIDGWQLKRSGKWKKKHTLFFNQLLKRVYAGNMEVIYVRGNHDDFLDQVIPFQLGNFKIVRDFTFESFGKKYFVVHGDVYDTVTSNMKWLAYLGDIGYTLLLWLNSYYNNWRRNRRLPYYSLSAKVKASVKSAVSFISDYEQVLTSIARSKGYDAVICGHIHSPCIREMEGFTYLNSGDWVESMTALAEDFEGHWHLLNYTQFQEERLLLQAQKIASMPIGITD